MSAPSPDHIRAVFQRYVELVTASDADAMVAYPTGADGMVVDTVDVMTFDDAGLITSMRAYWSADTIHRE